jgi:fumarate reductase subunit D
MPDNPQNNAVLVWPILVLVFGLAYLLASYDPERESITVIQALALAGLVLLSYRRAKRRRDKTKD